MSDDTASNPSKKRKANDGRADMAVGGGFLSSLFGYYFSRQPHDTSSTDQFMQQTLSHMERMEQSMLRMEEKLSTLSSVESRCKELEAKCSSLENKLDTTTQSVKEIDLKLTDMQSDLSNERSSIDKNSEDLNSMCNSEDNLEDKVDTLQDTVDSVLKLLEKNHGWEYPLPIDSYEWLDDRDEAAFLVKTAKSLKEKTIKLRAGVFPDYEGDEVDAILMAADIEDERYCCSKILPHWMEFALALKQFTPSIAEYNKDDGTYFEFGNFRLNKSILKLIKEALIGKPFKKMRFSHNVQGAGEIGGLCMDAILDVMGGNQHLQNLSVEYNDICDHHVEKLCSIIRQNPLVELNLHNSCDEPGVGNAILSNLLACRESKLEVLKMRRNQITSDACIVLADFLAANPKLKRLDLTHNEFNDSDVSLIANSLRSNTTLVFIFLGDGNTTMSMADAFRPVLFDDSSLNAAADSNHSCFLSDCSTDIDSQSNWNLNNSQERHVNRGEKIFYLLSFRHRTMSNTQYFSDMDVKILPNMLESIQRYGEIVQTSKDVGALFVKKYDVMYEGLSIVYEVMRKWDKVFCLYE